MELSSEIFIKEEQEFFSDHDDSLDLKFEILTDVKIEEIQILNNEERNEHCDEDSNGVVSYQELRNTSDQLCSICYRVLPCRYSLFIHNLSHLCVDIEYCKIQKYRCNDCSVLYYSEHEQKRHMCVEKQKNLLQVRKQDVISENGVTTDVLYSPNCGIPKTKALHKCETCNKIFTYKRWHEHVTNVHGECITTGVVEEKVKCAICDKLFKKGYIKKHMQHIHEGKKPKWRFHKQQEVDTEYVCSLCPAKFLNSSAYKTHLRNCHTGGIVECSICKSQMKKYNLAHHMQRKHCKDGKIHRCEYCSKLYKALYYLKVHMKTCRYKRT
ncbi:zinc finger protein 28-like isoform X2 [Galleria mellonella]|uniref:Zinc finger protein 28-like isoform X2 n=1 Tax=Galleria mellonella TaxID=7137 RepID=A0A6J1X330_GALME|nr:zinc finger protein 28-like isoform X2 [Galleria mellonella]